MSKLIKTALLSASLLVAFPMQASAYVLSDVTGKWMCSVQSKSGTMFGSYSYDITGDGVAKMSGWIEMDDGWSYMYIDYSADLELRVSGSDLWEIPKNVAIRIAEIDDVSITDAEKDGLRAEMMKVPEAPSDIRYVRTDELVYADGDVLSACVKG